MNAILAVAHDERTKVTGNLLSPSCTATSASTDTFPERRIKVPAFNSVPATWAGLLNVTHGAACCSEVSCKVSSGLLYEERPMADRVIVQLEKHVIDNRANRQKRQQRE